MIQSVDDKDIKLVVTVLEVNLVDNPKDW